MHFALHAFALSPFEMKASIELPIIEREILTWTNHEGINTPRSGRRHFNHQRSINSFNAFMNSARFIAPPFLFISLSFIFY
jgi:hypothetical protein